jgi:PAS domain S-box-containing protein
MRVLVVDDHEVVRKGVRSLLARAGYEICGEGVDGEDALEKAAQLRPDVIVMDVSMPKLNGLEATRKVRAILPTAEILILTQHDSPEMLRQAVSAGARGYVVKSAIAKDLLNAVEKLSHHESFFDAGVSAGVDKAGNTLDAQEILQRTSALERALRESEELYRATFDQAAVGMCHVSLDGSFLRVNSKLCSFLGYSEEELLRLTFMDVTHPDDLNLDMEGANSLRAGARQSYQIEKRYRCKDGSYRWGQLTVALLRKQDGSPKFFLSVVADIDQRKQAEEALR